MIATVNEKIGTIELSAVKLANAFHVNQHIKQARATAMNLGSLYLSFKVSFNVTMFDPLLVPIFAILSCVRIATCTRNTGNILVIAQVVISL